MRSSPQTVLVITSLRDATANMVIEALIVRRVQVARIDPADIGSALTFSAHIGDDRAEWGGWLRTASRDVALEEIGAAYYRRPSSWHSDAFDDQAQRFVVTEARYGLGGLLRSLPNCRYVNHPAADARADFKVTQLQAAAKVGLRAPKTLITNDLNAAQEFARKHDRVIYKSFRGAPPTSEGHVGAIWTQRISSDDLDDSLSLTAHLFQEEIQKAADVRVTAVGQNVFASKITAPGGALDWRCGDWGELIYEDIEVPEAIRKAIHAYLNMFGLEFGCFDFGLEGGIDDQSTESWTFIECNPNGQWGWLPNSDSIARAFAHVLLEGWWS
ncbi:ATP-grasp ribosomal peptide maturase [Nonomuraea sp. NPDC005650]|uniref:ATP-grasp ribosomal peptide maturase n=1 Tax=Nonomuraea sp. NPDC005650 TaxID=3157045 RepID=UPI0033B99A8A